MVIYTCSVWQKLTFRAEKAKFYRVNPIGAAEDVNVVRRRANAKKMFTTVTIGITAG